jgi:transketolase
MSCAELVSVLFFDEMRFDPKDPSGRDADVFILSKGHAAPILWAALKEAGAIQQDLNTLRRFDSDLEGHPTPRVLWVRVASGSLGQGLSAGAGMAWARKLDRVPARATPSSATARLRAAREAAQFASSTSRQPLRDRGREPSQTDRRCPATPGLRTASAFGWEVAVVTVTTSPRSAQYSWEGGMNGKPFGIVARTFKGKGVSFLQDKEGWHGKPVKKGDELAKAVAELGDTNVEIRVESRRYPSPGSAASGTPTLTPAYELGQEVATREAYGTALAKLVKACPAVVAIDGDTKNSTFAERLKEAEPTHFAEGYIAEQNMVGAALDGG